MIEEHAMRTRPLLVVGTVAIVATAGAFGAYKAHLSLEPSHADAAPAAAVHAMPVPVTKVAIETLPVYLDYPARIEAIRQVSLQAKSSGFLQYQMAQDGSDVREGDLLYHLDASDIQARLDQVRAQYDRDSANLDYLRQNYDRGTQLAKSGFLAKDSFDQRSSNVKQAEAALAMDQAAVRATELNLADTDIRAPFNGRLGRNQAAPGTYVNTGNTALNTLVQLSPIYVTFNPTEAELIRIQAEREKGDVTVSVSSPANPDAVQTGKLVFVDNALDRTTGTITARAVIENADKTLLPGQYVRIRVAIGQIDDAKMVPQVAVGSSQLGKYIYAVAGNNTVEQHLVSLGPTHGSKVAVLSGIKGDERIITGNLQKIGPGMPVQALEGK
jgi:multidrug efflux system membrane fusion protein